MRRPILRIATAIWIALPAVSDAFAGEYLVPDPDRRISVTSPGSEFSDSAALCSDNEGRVYAFWDEFGTGYSHVMFNRSLDGGTTWEDQQRYVDSGIGGGADRIRCSCDASGNVYAVYTAPRDGGTHALYVNRSRDYGETWLEEAALVSHSPWSTVEGPDWVVLRSDESGRVYVAWSEKRFTINDREIYFNYSDDYGATWQPTDTRLDRSSVGASLGIPVLQSDSQGTLVAIWLEGQPPLYSVQATASRKSGGSWLEPFSISDERELSGADLIAGIPGSFVAGWTTRSGEVRVSHTRDSGSSWSAPTLVAKHADPGGARFISMASDGISRVYVSYQVVHTLFVCVSEDGGRSFAEPIAATDEDAFFPARPSQIEVGANGHVIVAFEDTRMSNSTIFVTYSTDYGKTWSDDQPLDVGTNLAQHSTMSFDGIGSFYFAWTDWRDHGSRGDIYFNRGYTEVETRITGEMPRVVVPQSGGKFRFEVSLRNRGALPLGALVHLDAEIRPGRTKGPIAGPVSIDLPPARVRRGSFVQSFPAGLRPGRYLMRVNLAPPVEDRGVLMVEVADE